MPSPEPGALDLDVRRVQRALRGRRRYRYVRPQVLREADGLRIVSPCCSRNIDPQGGVIDIALLQWRNGRWHLFHKDHRQGCWQPHAAEARLPDLLQLLQNDEQRIFWP